MFYDNGFGNFILLQNKFTYLFIIIHFLQTKFTTLHALFTFSKLNSPPYLSYSPFVKQIHLFTSLIHLLAIFNL